MGNICEPLCPFSPGLTSSETTQGQEPQDVSELRHLSGLRTENIWVPAARLFRLGQQPG